jgi:chromosome segregation ATPase
MMRRSSSRRTPDKAPNELEFLYDELEEIESILEPLRDAQSDSLRAQAEASKKKLESLGDGELSAFRLSLLRREIRKLKARAESLANNSLVVGASILRNELDEIEQILQPLKDDEAEALQSIKEASKKRLESASKKDLPTLQEEIYSLKEQAEALATKSFLSGEIEAIDKILDSIKGNLFKRTEVGSLEKEKKDKKKELRSADEHGLASLRRDIRDLKERAEALAYREGWFVRFRRESALVWLGIIPLIVAIYASFITIWQWLEKPKIEVFYMQTATAQTATAQAMPSPTRTSMPTSTPTP